MANLSSRISTFLRRLSLDLEKTGPATVECPTGYTEPNRSCILEVRDIDCHQKWQQEQQSDILVYCYVPTHLALWTLQFAGAVTDGGKRLRLAFSAGLKEIVWNSFHGLSNFQYQTFSLKKVSNLRAIHRLTSTLSRCRHSMVVNLSSFWKQTSFLCFPNFSN